MMNWLKIFENTIAKNQSFSACRVQQPGEKLTDFQGDLKQLALKAYPTESQNI